jgi:hypothetical protein
MRTSLSSSLAWTQLTDPGQRENFGLWEVGMAVCGLGAGEADALVTPLGYGVSTQWPAENAPHSQQMSYASSGATMQWMAAGSAPAAAYFGAHDSTAAIKSLGTALISSARAAAAVDKSSKAPHRNVPPRTDGLEAPAPAGSAAARLSAWQHDAYSTSDDDATTVSLSVTWPVENAGLPRLTAYDTPFSLVLGVVNATRDPVWYGGAQIYRHWALQSAPWVQAGPVRNRPDTPPWLLDTHVWVNSGWQCHDIFNDTQGAPDNVLKRVRAIRARFNVSALGLHWYEFQQGPDPSPAARYKFDTHYPDYLPPRGGPDFGAVVAALKDDGVRVFPYINGRIFDIASNSYKAENGGQYCTQKPLLAFGAPNLTFYEESYGSGATFHVADPTET